MPNRLYTLFIIALLNIGSLAATDSVRLSLLTCSAGDEVYTLYGHTAIRYEVPERGIDVVFNYGMFDFSAPNFILRFALGETDYQLGMTDYRRFAAEYQYHGRDVWQQTLNLTPEEKQRLIGLLEENYRPANRVYRYNFFYDNCATRPRDQVERTLRGRLSYGFDMDSPQPGSSFRQLLHRYNSGNPWSSFGIDLCLGSEADRPISLRQMMFVPFYVQEFFRNATVRPDTLSSSGNAPATERKLVANEEKIISAPEGEEDSTTPPLFTPWRCGLLLFIIVCALSLWGIRRKRSLWGLDLLLYTAAGITGCILAFLVTLSQHPTVSPNWLLVVFHPLHLLALPCMLHRVRRHLQSRYQAANAVVLTLFILFWAVIPQRIPLTVLPLALSLLVRAVSNFVLAQQTAKK